VLLTQRGELLVERCVLGGPSFSVLGFEDIELGVVHDFPRLASLSGAAAHEEQEAQNQGYTHRWFPSVVL
jgi:hypothetical protein